MYFLNSINKFKKNTLKISGSAIATFMIVFLSSGFLIANDVISSAMTIALWAITLCFLFLFTKSINFKSIILVSCMLCMMWLSIVANRENIRNAFMLSFALLTTLVFVNTFSFESFTESYINVIYFLSVTSLIGFALFSFFPALQNYFTVTNMQGYRYSSLVFYIHPHEYNRNLGIFWEPGAFQTFVGLALLLEFLNGRTRMNRILVFIVTILSTFSTTGYVAIVLILLLMLFRSERTNINLKITVGLISVGLIIVFFVFQDVLLTTSGNTPFGKLIHFFTSKAYLNNNIKTSASIRFWGVIKPFEAFLESPILGWGYEGLQDKLYEFTYGMNTCTFVNWFAVYGGVFGFIMLSGMVRFARKLVKTRFTVLMVMVILFVLTISENYVNNASIMILSLYGFMPKERYIHKASRNQ